MSERKFSTSVDSVSDGAQVRALRIEAFQVVAIGEAHQISLKRVSARKVGAVGSLVAFAAVAGAAVCGGGEQESTLAPPEAGGGGEPLATRVVESPTPRPEPT